MTLISYRYKFIFLANMKCGSSTVHTYFKQYADEIYIKSINQKPLGKHDNAFRVKQYIESKGHKWKNFYVFTTIRNPFDRIKSCYYFEHQKSRNLPSFENYVITNKFLEEHYTPLEQFAFKNKKKLVNKIIKLENINTELSIIANKLNIPIKIKKIKIINASKKPFQLTYNKKMRSHLKKVLKKDFKFYKN